MGFPFMSAFVEACTLPYAVDDASRKHTSKLRLKFERTIKSKEVPFWNVKKIFVERENFAAF